MGNQDKRGSEKLMAAWQARALTEKSVHEIADALDKSRGKIESAAFFGGEQSTGLRLALRYDGDDGPWCGNDILFWLKWHQAHGGTVHPPRIIIDGTPWPDLIRMELDFGYVGESPRNMPGIAGQVGGQAFE